MSWKGSMSLSGRERRNRLALERMWRVGVLIFAAGQHQLAGLDWISEVQDRVLTRASQNFL